MYSRFVQVGALLVALALEANGFTPWGRTGGLLVEGIQDRKRRQCARCPYRESEHLDGLCPLSEEEAETVSESEPLRTFIPARYVLLTGDRELSPKNAEAVTVARSEANREGHLIKVVLGSQIASEGIDLRFIREVHVLDAWFHLNKTEQVIGRAIRFCSHSALDPL